METSASHVVKAHQFSLTLFMPTIQYSNSWFCLSSPSSQPYHGNLRMRIDQSCPNKQLKKVVKCSLSELERQLGDEIITEEELIFLGRSGGKCKETTGIAELLECLEKEAIMGEDEGKEPTDYNRRAQIFDKSSRVFQALKESTGDPPLA